MNSTKRTAIFPGSFDPFTIGHMSILEQAMPLFDEIIIAIGVNSAKKDFFPLDRRIQHITSLFTDTPKISVDTYTSLTIEYCKKRKAQFILRGLRNTTDFQFEKSIAQMNSKLLPEIETIFLVTPPEFGHVSSTIIRDLISYGTDVSEFIPGKI
ncbi:MAG: pantetheine-phosphate adenylyltransferase [Bacteroidales bacterium]|jgi:pantetheine-phosphate adenylyltransferase|nr:pantetheine-phosphate adenylyltransferase [Bacteroidales bacterium]